MSSLARYFMHEGREVAGYDRTPSHLTAELEAEGAAIHFEDGVELIPEQFKDRSETVVIYTPAIPADHSELSYFREQGFELLKRSEMLGELTAGRYVMAVAGSHGKSSTSTMVAWLNHAAEGQGCGILGAVSRNFNSNLVLGEGERVVVEADEFDRSFLRLSPDVAVVTAADADHLDIYGTHEAVKEAFAQFVERIKSGGALIIKAGVDIELRNAEIDIYRYEVDYQDGLSFYAENLELLTNGHYRYDIVTPSGVVAGCELRVMGRVNVENSVAAVASMWCAAKREGRELDFDKIREALWSFEGIKRRWEIYHNSPRGFYMDDYAHHPREIAATLSSLRAMMPGRELTAIFQPHLYSRTQDLYVEFAQALSLADRVVLLPIYPARELPVEGVTTELIANLIPSEKVEAIVPKEQLAELLAGVDTDVVVTLGAGDIDLYCEAIYRVVKSKEYGGKEE